TVGEELGRRLGVRVLDTDQWIEHKLQKKIKQIFSSKGETAFRRYETDSLKDVTAKHVIVTTGGGIVTGEENRRWMNNHGIVIYLHCDLDTLLRRYEADTERPLLKDKRPEDIAVLM